VLQQVNMGDAFALLEPFFGLIENAEVKEQVSETARIFFEGTGVTVSLIPSLIIGLLGLLGLLKLLGLPILASLGLGGGGSEEVDGGYGAPTDGYAEPSTGYGRAYARSDEYFDQTVADLQAQISRLQESEQSLRAQVYYNAESNSAGVSTNQIGYTS